MKLQLKRSDVLLNGKALPPTEPFMEYGELAVNYSTDDPALFIKDSANNIIRLGSVYDYTYYAGFGLSIDEKTFSITTGTPGSTGLEKSTDTDNGLIQLWRPADNQLLQWTGTTWQGYDPFTGSWDDITDKPTIGEGVLTLQINGVDAGTFGANDVGSKTINLETFGGNYNDLTNKPTIGEGTITIKQAGTAKGSFGVNDTTDTTIELEKFSGDWNDINDKPQDTIGNATIKIKQGSAIKGEFTVNQTTDHEIQLDAPEISNAVESVNGQTGVVDLGIKDMNDVVWADSSQVTLNRHIGNPFECPDYGFNAMGSLNPYAGNYLSMEAGGEAYARLGALTPGDALQIIGPGPVNFNTTFMGFLEDNNGTEPVNNKVTFTIADPWPEEIVKSGFYVSGESLPKTLIISSESLNLPDDSLLQWDSRSARFHLRTPKQITGEEGENVGVPGLQKVCEVRHHTGTPMRCGNRLQCDLTTTNVDSGNMWGVVATGTPPAGTTSNAGFYVAYSLDSGPYSGYLAQSIELGNVTSVRAFEVHPQFGVNRDNGNCTGFWSMKNIKNENDYNCYFGGNAPSVITNAQVTGFSLIDADRIGDGEIDGPRTNPDITHAPNPTAESVGLGIYRNSNGHIAFAREGQEVLSIGEGRSVGNLLEIINKMQERMTELERKLERLQ